MFLDTTDFACDVLYQTFVLKLLCYIYETVLFPSCPLD